ncbi:ABC transporter permease [Candidatus Poribacteria bacterium]|nr:ABC transporter permease [Candidatus Poribacteria bacterium]
MTRNFFANIGRFTIGLHSWIVYVFLYLPILILMVFSFNASRISTYWTGFTFRWYGTLLENNNMLIALKNSLIVAFASTIISTIIGTMTALGMYRYNFPGKRLFDLVLWMPIIIPDIVMGISLAIFYNIIRFVFGVFPIIVAHVAFNISYVAVVVRTRLQGYNNTLDEAAMDLGANPFQTFIRITLPLIAPGVIAGALMAFTLSFDEYLITSFVQPPGSNTLPIHVYSMIKIRVTPEINALSTLIMAFTMILILVVQRFLGGIKQWIK